MYRIKIDRDRCIGCLTCVTACVVSHESSDARNRVVIDSQSKCAPIFCRNCDRPWTRTFPSIPSLVPAHPRW